MPSFTAIIIFIGLAFGAAVVGIPIVKAAFGIARLVVSRTGLITMGVVGAIAAMLYFKGML